MFGFTEEETTPILTYLGDEEIREEIRTYYNGYRFSPEAEQTVYNSDMVLYYGLQYPNIAKRYVSMIDPNVVSDYRKIRAILSIGERELEEEMLTRIVEENLVAINEITPLFILTQETEFLFDEEALISLLFYMGYLAIVGRQGISITLAMPNLVLESLYLDYERFDEKYIKVVMLSLLSDVNIYISRSEYEVSANGYVDLYLQAAFEPECSASYFIELKYVKARTSKSTLAKKEREGVAAMQTYLQSETARTTKHLQAYVLVFRKNRCVRKIAC